MYLLVQNKFKTYEVTNWTVTTTSEPYIYDSNEIVTYPKEINLPNENDVYIKLL